MDKFKMEDKYSLSWMMTVVVGERRKLGMSQSDIAEKSGLNERTIQRMELSVRKSVGELSFQKLVKYVNALGYDMEISFKKR